MKTPTIRTATLADLKTIQEFNHALCKKEHEEYDPTINPDYPFSPEGEAYFRSKIESEDSLALIAEIDGKPVGYLVGEILPSEDYRTPIKMAEVENMYIETGLQGQGIGSQLNEIFEDWCKKHDVKIIKYVASAENIQAIGFYKKRGAKELNVTLEKQLV